MSRPPAPNTRENPSGRSRGGRGGRGGRGRGGAKQPESARIAKPTAIPPCTIGRRNLPTSAGWGEGDRTDYTKANVGIVNRIRTSARELEVAWGRGGSQGMRNVKQFDKQFRLLSGEILDLHDSHKLDKEAKEVVLQACATILALEDTPHWEDGHVEDIRGLRDCLKPDGYWNDYPEELDDDGDEMP